MTCLRNGVFGVAEVVGFGERVADAVLLGVLHALGVQIDHLVVAELIAWWRVRLTHHLHLHLSVLDHSLNVWNRSFRLLNIEFLFDRWKLLEIR